MFAGEPETLDIKSGDPAHLTALWQRRPLNGQRARFNVGTSQRHLSDELAVGSLDVAEHLEVVPDRERFPERGHEISIRSIRRRVTQETTQRGEPVQIAFLGRRTFQVRFDRVGQPEAHKIERPAGPLG